MVHHTRCLAGLPYELHLPTLCEPLHNASLRPRDRPCPGRCVAILYPSRHRRVGRLRGMTVSDLNAQQRALAAEVVSGTLTLEQAAERAGVPNNVVARWVSQLIFASAPALETRARTLITFSQPQIESKPSEANNPAAPAAVTSASDSTSNAAVNVSALPDVGTEAEKPAVEVELGDVLDDSEGERDSILCERPTLPRARPEIDEQAYSLVTLTAEQTASLADIDSRLLAALDGTKTVRQIFESLELDAYATRDDVQQLLALGYLVPSSIKPVEVPVVASEPPPQSYISISPFKPQRSRLAWAASVTALASAAAAGYVWRAPLLVLSGLAPAPKPPSYSAKPLDPPKTLTHVEAIPVVVPTVTKPIAANAACPDGMSFIAPGKFTMGSTAETDSLVHSKPSHEVEFQHGFCIDRTEVSVAAYAACVGSGKCTQASALAHWGRGNTKPEVWAASRRLHSQQCNAGAEGRADHPINCISWPQANTYCNAMGFHLPTEQQWEYAARGSAGRTYPWGDDAPNVNTQNACGKECDEWHTSVGLHSEVTSVMYSNDDTYAGTAPVSAFRAGATPEGVLDLAGNVAEWTANSWYEYADVTKDPALERPVNGAYHVIRGGAFNSTSATQLDATLRIAMPNPTFSHAIGFRCAAEPLP